MIATIDINKIISEMQELRTYLNGYFTNGNGSISDDITADDFAIERVKIIALKSKYELLKSLVKNEAIPLEEVANEIDKSITLLAMLNEWTESKKEAIKTSFAQIT